MRVHACEPFLGGYLKLRMGRETIAPRGVNAGRRISWTWRDGREFVLDRNDCVVQANTKTVMQFSRTSFYRQQVEYHLLDVNRRLYRIGWSVCGTAFCDSITHRKVFFFGKRGWLRNEYYLLFPRTLSKSLPLLLGIVLESMCDSG